MSFKREAVNALSKMSDSATAEDMMYRLYVLNKIKTGQEAEKTGKVIHQDQLKKEIATW